MKIKLDQGAFMPEYAHEQERVRKRADPDDLTKFCPNCGAKMEVGHNP